MKTKIEQFPANNPNPVLSVKNDGTVLYSNAAGEHLLHEWDMGIGEKLPSCIGDIVLRVISLNIPERMEVTVGKRVFAVAFHPLPEDERVKIYGFDISDYKNIEVRLREAHEQIQVQSEELQVSIEKLRVQSDELNDANVLLHDSVTGFRTLAENSPDLIARFDRQGHCLYANPAVIEFYDIPPLIQFYGLSINDFINKPNFEVRIDPEMMKLSEKQCKNTFTTGKPEAMVFHYLSPKGKKYYFDTKIVPEFANNEVVSVLVISRDITVIKEVEAKLKETLGNSEEKVKERTAELEEAYKLSLENEKRFNEAQKIAHIGSWDRDIVTGKLYWSDETYRIYGRSLQQFGATYDEFLSYVHPDDRDYVDNAVKEAINGKPYDIDYRIISANGEERIVAHTQGGAIFNEENIPVRLRGTVQDVTERKKAEEKIQRLANIVESSNDAIITSTLYGIITSWNKGAEQIYGYSAEEILGKHLSILEPSILVEESKELTELIEQGDRIHHHETFHLRKDSKIINVSLTLSPVFDSSGKMTDVSFISRDITESKRSEERYRTVTEQTGQVVYEYDLRTDKSIWAGAIEEVTGYSFEEFQNLGKDFWIKNIIHTDMNCVDGNFQDQEKTGYRFNEELRLRKKDGTCNHIDSRGIFLLDHAGQPYKAIGVLKDITKRKEAEEALADIEISRKKEIHHRIKNNLQVISSLLDLQAEKFKGRKDIKDSEVLEGFRESQNRVISMALIHEELYRGGEIDTLDFSSYIKELADNLFLTYRLGNNDISLKMSLEENIFYDMDTAVPLGIIINELVSNSLKHAFAGRDKGEIQIKLSRDENGESKNEDCMHTNFILSVSDNGVGIPEDLDIEDLDTLGMQLVTTLVEQLDGELELKRNNGTEFTIKFTVVVGLSHRKLEAQESRI